MKRKDTLQLVLHPVIFLIFSLVSFKATAQWTVVGRAAFTYNSTSFTSLAFDKKDQAYIAFSDSGNASKAGVMRYDTSRWVSIGPIGISPGKAIGVSLAIDTGNRPYLAFGDSTISGKLSLMKYNAGTNTWSLVQSSLSSGSVYLNTSMIFDKHNNLYFAYTDLGDSGKIVVRKYNGSAFTVAYVTRSKGYYPSLAVNRATDTVYLGFKDQSNSGRASVVNVISGTYVGAGGFSPQAANFTSLALDTAGVPYLAFQDSVTGGARVMKYKAGSWLNVGTGSFSAGATAYTSIAIGKNDTVFVGYSDTNGFATVMEYTGAGGTGWSLTGSADFSPGPVAYISLALDTSGHPWVAYQDGYNIGRATVMEYICSRPYLPAIVADSSICYGNQAVLRIAHSSLNATIGWQWYSGTCGGALIDSTLPAEVYVSPTVTSTYYVRGTGWCKTQDTCLPIVVVVDSLVTSSVSITANRDSVCPGTVITFTASPVNGGAIPIFQWKKNGQNINASGSQYRDSTLVNNDKITCVLFPGGCSSAFLVISNVLKVHVVAGPRANIAASGPLTFCHGDSITLQAPAGDSAYRWSTGDSVRSVTVKTSGIYSVTASYNGCTAHGADTITASAHNLNPVITHNRPLLICPGGHVILDAGAGYTTYRWSNGDSTQTIVADTSAIYRVTVTQLSCTGNVSDTVIDSSGFSANVHITPSGNVDACAGDTVVLDAGPNFDSYLWSNGDTTETTKVSLTATYIVSVTQNACQGADAVNVTIHSVAPPTILSSDTVFTVCHGHAITLRTNFQYNSYHWSNDSTTPTILVNDSGTFNVTVSVNTCTGTAVSPVFVTDFTHLPITLDTIQDTVGVTTIYVHPALGTHYYWQSVDTNAYSTTADSVIVYCYSVVVKSLANWTLVDSAHVMVYVVMSSGNCRDTSAGLTITCAVDTIISASENILNPASIHLLPNPANELLYINYELPGEAVVKISVTDMQGRLLMPEVKEEKNAGSYANLVNVRSLAGGVYLVNFESGSGRMVKRFVKE